MPKQSDHIRRAKVVYWTIFKGQMLAPQILFQGQGLHFKLYQLGNNLTIEINIIWVECNIRTSLFQNGIDIHIIHKFLQNLIIEVATKIKYFPVNVNIYNKTKGSIQSTYTF